MSEAMRPHRIAAWPVVLLLMTGCDPAYSVHGTVLDAAGAAVTGANVTLSCPSGTTESAVTTATGEFAFGGVGGSFEAPRCSLRIEKPGFATQTVRTTDACYRSTQTRNYGTRCGPGEGEIRLAR
jgi:hypothetical protein